MPRRLAPSTRRATALSLMMEVIDQPRSAASPDSRRSASKPPRSTSRRCRKPGTTRRPARYASRRRSPFTWHSRTTRSQTPTYSSLRRLRARMKSCERAPKSSPSASGSRWNASWICPPVDTRARMSRTTGSSARLATQYSKSPALYFTMASASAHGQQLPVPLRVAQRKVVAGVDFRAMHAVDEEKIAEHEILAPVHRVEGALEHALPAVEGLARGDALASHIVGRHAGGAEGQVVVAVLVVQPPALVQQPAFLLQPRVQRRAGKRREMVERGQVEPMLDGELGRLFRRARLVAVVAEHEGAVHADAMPAQVG